MTLPSWDSLPIRTKRSRKRLYGVLATEYSLTAWKSLPHNVKRSKKNLYNYIASQKNLEEYDELAKNNMRSTRLLYNYIKDNASGSKPTLTIKVKDGDSNVSGATVTIGSTEKTTDASGETTYSLDYDNYTVSVEKSGYLDYSENIKFRANHKTFTIPLEAEPSETGTVTVTCQDGSENLLSEADVILLTENAEPSPTNAVGVGVTGEDGTTLLYEFDEQGRPTQTVKQVEYGDYYLIAEYRHEDIVLKYSGALTVDGDEEVTITLTAASGTGTVTVTCQDSSENPVPNAFVDLTTVAEPSSSDDWVATGITGNDGTVILETPDKSGEYPVPSGTVANVPFGNYYLTASDDSAEPNSYTGTLTVDGDEEVTITLTQQ